MAELAYAIDSKSIARKGLWVQLPPPAPKMKRILVKNNKATLAYVIGVALGDGNLSNPNGRAVRLRVSCDAKYPGLIKKIQKAIQSLFPNNKVSQVVKQKNCIDISCYSNEWEKILGWMANGGSKFKQNVDIPKWVFSKKKYLISCLKGLIETDGTIYTDRGYKMVMFTSTILCLAESVNKAVKQLRFGSHFYKIAKEKQASKYGLTKSTLYRVRISKKTEQFLKLVKPLKS